MKNTVYLCGMGMTAEEYELAIKIGDVLKDKVKETGKEVEVTIHDVKVHGEITPKISITFGSVFGVSGPKETSWVAPKLSRMTAVNEDVIALKQKVMDILQEVTNYIKNKKEPIEMYVETPSGVTFGGIGAMISITPEEAEHLKKIRDILGGGKMVITKGDLKIEVE